MNQICAVSKHKSQVFLVLKEYKGCPMLNQTDFSDKLQWSVVALNYFYLSLSRQTITDMCCPDKLLQIHAVHFVFKCPVVLMSGTEIPLYIYMISCYFIL